MSNQLYVVFINFGGEAKDSQKSEHNPSTSQKPHEGNTNKGHFNFRCGRKTPGKTHTKRKGLKTPFTQCSRWDSNRVLEVEGEERYHNTNPTAQTKGELF